MLVVRKYDASDAPAVWAPNQLPHRGATGDSSVPLRLEPLTAPPPEFPDINHTFIEAGGDFFVAEMAGGLVGMGRVPVQ